MVFTTLLLLTVLFVSGLYIYFPNNKFRVWLHSQFQFQLVFTSSDEKVVVVERRRRRSVVGVVEGKKRGNEGELKRVFATFDKNSDGFITKQELKESLKNIRVFMSDQEVEEMMSKADANGDGLIDFAEFCSLCEGQTSMMSTEEEGGHVADQEEELKEAFDVFDKDKDGLISVEELGVVLCSLGLREGNRVEACKEMVKYVDQDGDGMVNFDEFKMMMKGNGGGGGRLLAAY